MSLFSASETSLLLLLLLLLLLFLMFFPMQLFQIALPVASVLGANFGLSNPFEPPIRCLDSESPTASLMLGIMRSSSIVAAHSAALISRQRLFHQHIFSPRCCIQIFLLVIHAAFAAFAPPIARTSPHDMPPPPTLKARRISIGTVVVRNRLLLHARSFAGD